MQITDRLVEEVTQPAMVINAISLQKHIIAFFMLVFFSALFSAPTQAAFDGLLTSSEHESQWMTDSKASYTKTQYPLVLAHGLFGFDQIGNLEYWHGIPAELEASGAQVFVTQVAAANSSEVRGEQLLAQVQEILAITGAKKVNLIGHSHGGQSIRYVAAMIPDQIASVTTVGSPVLGSPVADGIKRISEVPVIERTLTPKIAAAVDAFAGLISEKSGQSYEQDALAAMDSLTSEGAADFNARFPVGVPDKHCGVAPVYAEGMYLFSWSGEAPKVNRALDPLSKLLKVLQVFFAPKVANDGLVSTCSSHFGRVIRDDFPYDHFDEVNQVAGLIKLRALSPTAVFRGHANRLARLGL